MASSSETSEGNWEYPTYAPKGQRCTVCAEPIRTFELALRGQIERASEPPVVIYRHAGTCPR